MMNLTSIIQKWLKVFFVLCGFLLLHGCVGSPHSEVRLIPDDNNEMHIFPQIVDQEGFRLNYTDSNQTGYRGHYLSGRLSERIQGMSLEQKASMLIYLLGKEGATEFDGEVAYEFKHDFFGSDFHKVAGEARRLLRQDSAELGLSHGEFKRVKTWLEARKSFGRSSFNLIP